MRCSREGCVGEAILRPDHPFRSEQTCPQCGCAWWGKAYASNELAFLRTLRICRGAVLESRSQGAEPVANPPRICLILPAPEPEQQLRGQRPRSA